MKYTLYIFCLCLISCTEFLSPDISEEAIEINSPRDSLYANNTELTFWWEEAKDIENYRLQIVQPDFENPIVILDSLLADTRISLILGEGHYSWRIRGENESSDSPYQLYQFSLDQSAPEQASLLAPIEASTQSKDDVLLRWDSQDQAIEGKIAAVSDSITVYNSSDNELIVRQSREDQSWQIEALMPSVPQGDSLKICWWVRSQDPAGNASVSDTFSFYIK
ncbi:MAG: hypothetical protein AAFN10_28100 [Bacteroidota bacterium]